MKTSLYFAAASGSAAGAAAALGLRRSTSLGLREALRMSSRLTDLVRKRAIGRAAARVQGPEAFNALASRAQRSGIDMLQLPKVESRGSIQPEHSSDTESNESHSRSNLRSPRTREGYGVRYGRVIVL